MSQPGHAVFLSYAHEDAEAARRIAEALRAAGIEVWFDQSELRGGDAWDAKLRGQIKTCALFLPIVSQNTEERSEGYFRREWKLAVDRTNDMAGGRAFLVPVAIDGTPEAGAAVPEEFTRYQWVRLPGGAPTPEFVAQVKHLLDAPRKHPALKPSLPRPPTLPPQFRQAAQAKAAAAAPTPAKKSPPLAGIALALGAVAVSAGLAFYVLRRDQPVPAIPAVEVKPVPVATPPAVVPPEPVITDKSIAVLPFENMSTDKENAFFADGVHEDILTNLGKIAELKVIARTSVMEYRGTTKKIQQIAKELGVAYILEGSVRRAKNTVRITVQLIDGKTGQHVLAPDPYDRDLADIFAIQSEVAKNIAMKLQAALSPGTKAALERAPTANLSAYDLYLKAREVAATEPDLRTRISRALPLLESVVQQDPNFSQAWLGIATLHLSAYTDNGFDHTPVRAAQAKSALDRAMALDPDDVGTVGLLANYYIDVRDLARAQEVSDRLMRLFPNHAMTFHVFARLVVRQGRPDESLANYRKARELDPRNPAVLEALSTSLRVRRQYDEAGAVLRELYEIRGENSSLALAWLAFDSRGNAAEVEAALGKLPPDARRTDPVAVGRLSSWAFIRGDADEVISLWEQSGANWRMPLAGVSEPLGIATAFVVKGQPRKARPILAKERERLVAQLAARPVDGSSWFQLAMTHALLGEKKEALEVRQRMLAAISDSPSAIRGFNEVVFYAWVGDKDLAIADLTSRLAQAGTFNVHRMRRSLLFQPLQGDPRFEALLADPKNNAPLF